jgi:hypothetical protein
MSFNLIRNSRMFFTTNVAAGTGVVAATGFLPANTFEIQVMDGFSFSQNTTAETVTLNEAGASPVRGQRSFNTALEPVDYSFSTYMRPADGGLSITAEESVLWNALLGTGNIGDAGAAWSDGVASATVVATNSQAHQLQAFGLIIVIDGTSYVIDNCALDQASIDFGLDAIAMIAWTGKGTKLRQVAGLTATTGATVTLANGLAGTAKGKNTTAPYIANKLSTLVLDNGIDGVGTNNYTVAITGGNLTIANNLTYLTPANLGVVNLPVTYFTGTRAISGSLTAYLRAGALNTAGLMADMLASSSTDVNPAFMLQVNVGGTGATRVEFEMPAAVLTIPSVSTEQVVSTTINFTAQGSTTGAFDIGAANELEVRYFTTNAA